jgi:pimeloyl-ACP methyl ester carboxylesterase
MWRCGQAPLHCAGLKEEGVELTNRLAGLLLLLPLALSCAGGGDGPGDRTVNIGSHSLHAVVAGAGSPAVVFDGGIGARCEEYRELQDRIAATTTTVIYDRAGYGPSEVGPLPRDSRSEAEELRALLAKLKIPGPYVVVGHSLGGLNVQVYANLHPEEVAGMVLLDPPPLDFILGKEYTELASVAAQMTDEWQGIADKGLRSDDGGERANAQFFLMLASEHREMFDGSAKQASSIASYGDTPLVVIASGVPNPMFGDVAESYQKFWATQSEALAAKSSRGEFVFAEKSTHRLHDDASDLVADRILSMVRSSRDSTR